MLMSGFDCYTKRMNMLPSFAFTLFFLANVKVLLVHMSLQFVIVGIMVIIVVLLLSRHRIERFGSTITTPVKHIKMKRCDTTEVSNIEKNVLAKFAKVADESWNLYVPCGYTHVEKELSDNNHFTSKRHGWVLGIDGSDFFAAKDRAWLLLKKRYGRLRATIFMPETYLTYDSNDMNAFYKDAKTHPGTMYIMKKNVQQQQGLHIFTDPFEAVDAFNKGYVVVQRVLVDPFLIDGRKINLRVYVLLVCHRGKKYLYVYDDGFVYYSKVPYVKGTTRDEVITSGYIERSVYEKNPLTTKEFLRYLHEGKSPKYVDDFIRTRNYVLQGFMDAAKDSFCVKGGADSDVIFAQTFGVDVQPNRDMTDVKILEWNKGPSLEVMDVERDGPLKQRMVDDVFRTIGIVRDSRPSGFVKLWG